MQMNATVRMKSVTPIERSGTAAAISVRKVTKVYDTAKGEKVHALDTLDLDIRPGEFVSVVGPSGCGKSTLMMMIAGLAPVTTGEILIDGTPPEMQLGRSAVVFQRDLLLEWRSVLDNVLLPIEIKKLDRAHYRDKALELLDLVGLAQFADRYPNELSGGMRQRVAICRALVQRPGLLLMDEPFGALDALTREQMNLDLQRMWTRDRNTVVFITHSIEEAVLLSDRVVVMSQRPGKVSEVYDIDIPRPRGAQSRRHPAFLAAVEGIRKNFMTLGILSES
jgi:NitT/TauT family transport system ATP-binding protein